MRRKTPSPATAISIIALVFAVAGTALASVATITVLSKKEKKQTRAIADAQINQAAPGLSVAHASTANSANDSNSIDGLDSSAFSRVVGAGTVHINPAILANGACQSQGQFVGGGAFSGVQPGDVALVSSDEVFLVPQRTLQDTAGRMSFSLCNFSGATFDAGPTDYRVIVLR